MHKASAKQDILQIQYLDEIMENIPIHFLPGQQL